MEVQKVILKESKSTEQVSVLENSSTPIAQYGENSPINILVNLITSIDENSPEAKLNEISISDGIGGRILL